MKAEDGKIVHFHYRLTGDDGQLIEESGPVDNPVRVMLGRKQMIAGVESALIGHQAGDKFEVDLKPEDAYGARQENRLQRVPKKYFAHAGKLLPGKVVSLHLRQGGEQRVTVRKVGMSTVDVDTNHPLAGKNLHFAIEVVEVRDPTEREKARGAPEFPSPGGAVG